MTEKDKVTSVIVEILGEATLDKLKVIATFIQSYLHSRPS